MRLARTGSRLGRLGVALLATLLAIPAIADKPPEDKPRDEPEAIEQDEPSFYVRVKVDRQTRQYREGDTITVAVESEVDAHAYVLYKQADGKVFLIFPNSDQKDNRIAAKKPTLIPAPNDLFRWQVGAPFGKEVLKVIASKEPLPSLSAPELFEGRFNRLPKESVKQTREQLAKADPKGWAEDMVELTTYSASEPDVPVLKGRRVGVFLGISKFRFHNEVLEATEGKWGPNLPCSANNAKLMARFSHELSRLDEYRVYVDEQATKAGFEEAIARWLPSVTKPGDTVVIFISSHGDQVLDDNGDERDGKDEWIVTHDYVDLAAMTTFLKRHEAGKLDPAIKPWFDATMTEIKRRKLEKNEQVQQLLVHKTGITDDLFGHWLQRLAGRQVVVLMETCHSGGFATNEKSLAPVDANVTFDFLDEELGRLKDLGQPDSVMISACRAQEVAYAVRARDEVLERMRADTKGELDKLIPKEQQIGVLTYYLAEGLALGASGMKVEDLYRHVQQGFAKYFAEINPILEKAGEKPLKPHFAEIFNNSTRPIFVKP